MYIPASKLRRCFNAKGRFYRICIDNGIEVLCRSTLEIFRRGFNFSINKPNALFVMMNPGGSSTRGHENGKEDGELYSHTSLDLAEKIRLTPLYDANPDRTQFQVMRIMEYYKWNYVRVLNLSDIRDVTSGDFIQRHREYNNTYLSIFSQVRDQELFYLLEDIVDKPVIAAWGVSLELEKLATRAIKCLPQNIKGIQGNDIFKYLHPLPRKWSEPRKWLKRFLEEVDLSS